ncbi:MAG: hypothetical protein Q8K32_21600 [Archangium sp.]|nr:hypothetical protein [Archangium sp.]
MSTSTDLARRLELSGVQELGDGVSGLARGMTVTLQGEPPFSGCVVELAAALPIAQVVMRPGDLNHPDAVETGDAAFDEQMQVTALAGYAPTLQKLLTEKPVRRAIIEFFQRHPDAAFNGSRLHVPSASGVNQALLTEALALAEVISERFTTIGFLETERTVDLPEGAKAIGLGTTLVLGGSGGAALFIAAVGLLDLQADGVGLLVGVLCFLSGLLAASLGHPPDKK